MEEGGRGGREGWMQAGRQGGRQGWREGDRDRGKGGEAVRQGVEEMEGLDSGKPTE